MIHGRIYPPVVVKIQDLKPLSLWIWEQWQKQEVTLKLLGKSSDPSPHSSQVCAVVGSVFGLNRKVCSANSNSISLGAREPWGLKWTLVSLCRCSIAPCLLAVLHTPLLHCAIIHKHFCGISVQRKHSERATSQEDLQGIGSLWADRLDSLCSSRTPGRQTCGSVCHCRPCTRLDTESGCSWNSHDDTRWGAGEKKSAISRKKKMVIVRFCKSLETVSVSHAVWQ